MRKSGLALVALLTWAEHCCGAEQDQGQWFAVIAPAFRAELTPDERPIISGAWFLGFRGLPTRRS
jgi:hypothetical protein